MNCRGIHCSGCGDHGGRGAGALAVLVVLAVIVGAAKRAAHTIGAIVHVVFVATVSLILAAVVAIVAVLVIRHRAAIGRMLRVQRRPAKRAEIPASIRVLSAAERAALPAPEPDRAEVRARHPQAVPNRGERTR
jgi:hypothetical protein